MNPDFLRVHADTYKKGYPWTTEEARKGNLIVVGHYTSGFSLYNKRTGDKGMWFKRKRAAIKKITDLINCPNS